MGEVGVIEVEEEIEGEELSEIMNNFPGGEELVVQGVMRGGLLERVGEKEDTDTTQNHVRLSLLGFTAR